MIGFLRGQLIHRNSDGSVVVDVNGVGYQVLVPGPTSAGLGDVGVGVELHIHTRVREDAITLFGFRSVDEKRCFEALIATHGVGPSMALAMLSLHSPTSLRHLVATEDLAGLSQVPGIGKKTAQRLQVELRSQFDVDDFTGTDSSHPLDLTVTDPVSAPRNDAIAALSGLGYGGDEIRQALTGLPNDVTAEQLVRLALKELATS